MSNAPKPFRRKVFYIPGYDPFPPRRYRELYRAEGAAQAAISGYSLTLQPSAPRKKGSDAPYAWQAVGVIDGAQADVDFEVMIWSDIVKSSMPDGILATYWQMFNTMWIYARSGAFFRQMRLRKGPTVAAMYPVLHLIGQAAIAAAIGALLAWALSFLLPALSALGVLAAYGFLALAKKYDHRILAHYLMHDFAFSAQYWGAYPPQLSARMDTFAARIRAAFDAPYDEVLIVGHSSGAYMGVTILSDILRAGLPQPRPAIGFLSLGQVAPMVSFLPRATRLRGDLHYLCQRGEITWVDVTAPGDGCAFALCDPVAVTGLAPPAQKWPLIVSCAFTQTLSPQTWARLRYKFFRLHFQYMCAFDRVGHYDYFRITAGPQTLAQRYAGVAPSPQRITRALSKYRDIS
ncbi:MAG: hypothetical protein U5N55_09300 [Cypionkella sp.]|nr:hypothetical protein [Cypionkella sp.]